MRCNGQGWTVVITRRCRRDEYVTVPDYDSAVKNCEVARKRGWHDAKVVPESEFIAMRGPRSTEQANPASTDRRAG